MFEKIIADYQHDLRRELGHILDWWEEHIFNHEHGGLYGSIDHKNKPNPDAPLGLVMCSQLLWSFSAGPPILEDHSKLVCAKNLYTQLVNNFLDQEYGGAYWTIAPDGSPLNPRKQTAGLAAAIYGLSEYGWISVSNEPLKEAAELFRWIENHLYDAVRGGYLEACAPDGATLTDMRLTAKDRNDPKTAQTHLRLLEAYTNLYRYQPDAQLAGQLRQLIQLFFDHIINPLSGHLTLHFDTGWAPQSDSISYGLDIEAARALLDAAEALGDGPLRVRCRENLVIMATAAAQGLDETDGGLWYSNQVSEKYWWAQAEAMCGFLHAWGISGEAHFLEKSLACWRFVQKQLLDRKQGEWFFGIDAKQHLLAGYEKAGMEKGPLHQARACMEIMRLG
ncbi:MAG: AGE family epimerase/isomerase [Saprospiraceae bacterium]|nr:AGE family epimerase/isomerase [Lewinellaceae bacterium]